MLPQVVDLLVSLLGLPEVLVKYMAGLLSLGVVPVVIISWVYQITPEGLKRESSAPEDEFYQQQLAGRTNIAVILLVTIAIVLLTRQPGTLYGHGWADGIQGQPRSH